MHLVREAAGADDGNLEVLRIALDRLAQCAAELEATPCGRNRKLQHPDLERNDRARPAILVRPQKRQWREAAVVQALRLEVRQVELVGDQARRDMTRKPWVSLDGRQLARPTAFVCGPVPVADAEGEMGIVVEEERGNVVVIDEEQHVRTLVREPFLDRLVPLEDRRPDGVLLLVRVEGEADRRSMRRRDAAHYCGHEGLPSIVLKVTIGGRAAAAGRKGNR